MSQKGTTRSRSKRSKHVIFAFILKRLSFDPCGPTYLMQVENLSYQLTCTYLREMTDCGLIRKMDEDGRTLYLATEKGRRFVDQLTDTLRLLDTSALPSNISIPDSLSKSLSRES